MKIITTLLMILAAFWLLVFALTAVFTVLRVIFHLPIEMARNLFNKPV